MQKVWAAIDELVHKTRPTILLYLAVDGVAPRAKMNQQRARRYRAAKEKEEKMDWDRNQITPGTPFMTRLSSSLQSYVATRRYPFTVILSDSFVAGEGEHKILKLLRELKTRGGSVARHCIFGGDADLCLLALLTNEPNIIILRQPNEGGIDVAILRSLLEIIHVPDFIVLSFLAGNDFVPNVPGFDVGQEILSILMLDSQDASPIAMASYPQACVNF